MQRKQKNIPGHACRSCSTGAHCRGQLPSEGMPECNERSSADDSKLESISRNIACSRKRAGWRQRAQPRSVERRQFAPAALLPLTAEIFNQVTRLPILPLTLSPFCRS